MHVLVHDVNQSPARSLRDLSHTFVCPSLPQRGHGSLLGLISDTWGVLWPGSGEDSSATHPLTGLEGSVALGCIRFVDIAYRSIARGVPLSGCLQAFWNSSKHCCYYVGFIPVGTS